MCIIYFAQNFTEFCLYSMPGYLPYAAVTLSKVIQDAIFSPSQFMLPDNCPVFKKFFFCYKHVLITGILQVSDLLSRLLELKPMDQVLILVWEMFVCQKICQHIQWILVYQYTLLVQWYQKKESTGQGGGYRKDKVYFSACKCCPMYSNFSKTKNSTVLFILRFPCWTVTEIKLTGIKVCCLRER